MELQDFKTLHEGVGPVSFVMSTYKAAKEMFDGITGSGSLENIGKAIASRRKSKEFVVKGNIAKAAQGLTAVFPVIVTEATDVKTAVMISKALERKAVGMLQMLFAAYQITDARDAKTYLGNFHSNISSSLDLSSIGIDDILDMNDDYFSESVGVDKDLLQAVCEDCRYNCNHVLETGITAPSISRFKVQRDNLNESYVIHEFSSRVDDSTIPVFTGGGTTPDGTRLGIDVSGNVEGVYNSQGKRLGDATDADRLYFDRLRRNAHLNVNPEQAKRAGEFFKNQVLPTDIKKANEATPSLMVINFISNSQKGEEAISSTCVIGVKCMLHYVSSSDLINRVMLKNTDRRGLFNLIRATTREISFFKDFLFSVKKAKVDAIAKSGKGSTNRLWKLLELRANRLKTAKATNMKEADYAAITSVIISQAEVDYIKKEHRIDLMSPGTLLGIMRGYNLMATVIVDAVDEKVNFLYDDGVKNFETLSFMSLERDEAGSEYKKVVNLLMKGR